MQPVEPPVEPHGAGHAQVGADHPARVAAVVLTGGGGTRLGGTAKHALEVGGRTLLERALDALTERVEDVVVVGPEVPTRRPVLFTREEPPGGGPAAGLVAGIGTLERLRGRLPDRVVALAVDMPLVTPATINRLLAALDAPGPDPDRPPEAAVLVDAEGHRQPLCAVYRAAALLAAVPGARHSTYGLPMRRLLFGLRLVEVPAREGEAADVDTWEDLRDLRERVAPPPPEA